MAVYMASIEPGDTVMGMDLAHGAQVNFSGRPYFAHYGVNRDTELINYDLVREQVLADEPDMIVAGASAYPRISPAWPTSPMRPDRS